jgi:hypothetical protein
MTEEDKTEGKKVNENKEETKVNCGKEMQINGVLVLPVYTHFCAVYIPLCHPRSWTNYVLYYSWRQTHLLVKNN